MVLQLTVLTVLTIVAEPAQGAARLAGVSPEGAVMVSSDRGVTWRSVHHCPLPLATDDDESCARVAAVAWLEGALYLACSGDSLFTWRSGQSAARPQGLSAPGNITALGTHDNELLLADDDRQIWSYAPGGQATLIAGAPESISSIAGGDAAVFLAGPSAVWRRNDTDSGWMPLVATGACGLAVETGSEAGERLWIAGPAGLFSLQGHELRTVLVLPVTGVAVLGQELLFADGASIREWKTEPSAPPHGHLSALQANSPVQEHGPGIDSGALARRMGLAGWLPRLGAGLSYQRHNHARHVITAWLWLSWSP